MMQCHWQKKFQQEKFVSVHENWNHALNKSSGDYILMLGDDDYMLPGYFKKMDKILERYDYPECVTYNLHAFIFPNAISASALISSAIGYGIFFFSDNAITLFGGS